MLENVKKSFLKGGPLGLTGGQVRTILREPIWWKVTGIKGHRGKDGVGWRVGCSWKEPALRRGGEHEERASKMESLRGRRNLAVHADALAL